MLADGPSLPALLLRRMIGSGHRPAIALNTSEWLQWVVSRPSPIPLGPARVAPKPVVGCLAEAARLTGKNVSTIHRATEAGRLSYILALLRDAGAVVVALVPAMLPTPGRQKIDIGGSPADDFAVGEFDSLLKA